MPDLIGTGVFRENARLCDNPTLTPIPLTAAKK